MIEEDKNHKEQGKIGGCHLSCYLVFRVSVLVYICIDTWCNTGHSRSLPIPEEAASGCIPQRQCWRLLSEPCCALESRNWYWESSENGKDNCLLEWMGLIKTHTHTNETSVLKESVLKGTASYAVQKMIIVDGHYNLESHWKFYKEVWKNRANLGSINFWFYAALKMVNETWYPLKL